MSWHGKRANICGMSMTAIDLGGLMRFNVEPACMRKVLVIGLAYSVLVVFLNYHLFV